MKMAFYKETCIRCGALIDPDVRSCPKCGSRIPFGDRCFTCMREISRDDRVCSGCGRQLHVVCPVCGETTFMQDRCEKCNADLMIICPNKRCGAFQFYDTEKCTACGKKIKKRK